MDAPLDPYLELGVPPAASTSEITDAYHRLVRQYHPDTGPQGMDAKASAGALLRVMAAYRILENPSRRNNYDRHHPARGPRSLPHRTRPLFWIVPPERLSVTVLKVTTVLGVTPLRWHERLEGP